MKYSGIGGQAVIEGIMMKNGCAYAVGVRKPDGNIEVVKDEYHGFSERHAFARLPLVRGVFAFVESLTVGLKTLMISASFYGEEEEETEPGAFEKWLEKVFGEKAEKAVMTLTMVLAFAMAVVLFMWLPLFLAGLLKPLLGNLSMLAFVEGMFRLLLFILYIKLISRTEDIRRTFMYHGAEHKCINCVEHGLPLEPDNVLASSRFHKRCGTSFIFLVMMISILFFMVIRVEGLLMRFASRILLVPVIAGVSYEFLRLGGRSDNPVVDLFSRPGLWMQRLTTSEPDRSMAEVAIAAVEAVFDWKAYEAENFPDGPDALGKKLKEEYALQRAVQEG